MMNVFQFAMRKEKDAEVFYRELAAKAGSVGLRRIFNFLADAEVRHYQVVEEMQEHISQVPSASILEDTVAEFRKMREAQDYDVGYDARQLEVYEKARLMEKESLDFYTQQAVQAKDEAARKVFEQLAAQERMHYRIVDNLAEFVIRPQLWVENGEFSHILDADRGTHYYPGQA